MGDLRQVKATHDSPYGWIASDWQIVGDGFRWKIIVPANTTATVWLPVDDAAAAYLTTAI